MKNERGFALIAALWLVVAVSAVALQLSLSSRARRLAAANTVDLVRAESALNAAIAHTRSRLERALTDDRADVIDPWRRLDVIVPDSVSLAESGYVVRAHDVGARLNLNEANEAELARFFLALGIDAGRANRVAAAVADWRDQDEERRTDGAERADYLRDGLPRVPSNGPFVRLNELRHVRGVDDRLYERALPYLTLAGTGHVNFNSAAREVLLALPGVTSETVLALSRLTRTERPPATLQELSLSLSPLARRALQDAMPLLLQRAIFRTRSIEVVAESWVAGSPARARARVLIERTRSGAVVTWRSPA